MSCGAKADFVFMLCPSRFSWPSCLTFKDFRCFILDLFLFTCIDVHKYTKSLTKATLTLNLVHMKTRWLIQIHVRQTGLNARQSDWWSTKRLIRSRVLNAGVYNKLDWILFLVVWMALKNEISERNSSLFNIFFKYGLHSLFSIHSKITYWPSPAGHKPSWHSSVGRAFVGVSSPPPPQYLLTGTWKRPAQLPWCLQRGQQVSHQRWILGNV